jgi:predicted molibdopterin-dependent oxidoreductase YjgC
MGYAMPFVAEEIMEEIRLVTPSYNGITYKRLEEDGLNWPCLTEEHPGTPILHIGQFTRGKGLFFAIDYITPAEIIDDEYPFFLNTGRVSEHYHTGTMTRKGTGLNRLYPEPLVEINPTDAEALELSDGDYLEITSRRGRIKIKAQLTRRTNIGTVFVPFHFHEAAANILTHTHICPVAKIPGFKVSAVKINKAI